MHTIRIGDYIIAEPWPTEDWYFTYPPPSFFRNPVEVTSLVDINSVWAKEHGALRAYRIPIKQIKHVLDEFGKVLYEMGVLDD